MRSLFGSRDIIVGNKDEVIEEIYYLADNSKTDMCVIVTNEDGTTVERRFIHL